MSYACHTNPPPNPCLRNKTPNTITVPFSVSEITRITSTKDSRKARVAPSTERV